MKVVKFGGSSLASASQLKKILNIVKSDKERRFVVVSAPIGDYVILGGYTLVFQFCRIGDYAMTAFAAGVHKDVPPYFMAAGYRAEPAGINSEGMRRNGFTAEQISAVKDVYKTIYHRGIPFEEAKADILQRAETQAELAVFKDFFAESTRGIIR